MVLVNGMLLDQAQDVMVLLLEIFVGLASFTGCLVAVDKLYLFYAVVFYKTAALISPDKWEPTLRYPRKFKRGAKVPTVTIQLPMFNETFVARRVIDYSCRMDYPRDKLYIQVLDDSTDPETRAVVDEGIEHWRKEGMKIDVIRRTNRQGYKAGAMHEVHEAIPCEFIGILDADFLPTKDFLLRAIPVFQDKNVGFVQGRWTYLNADESLFCRYQEICLNAHIKGEQYARFSTGNFTPTALAACGERRASTPRADGMREHHGGHGPPLRAFLKGWHFVWYDIARPNEIPSDYKAYRTAAPLVMRPDAALGSRAPVRKRACCLPLHKAYLNIFFFGVRMLATNVISFTFYSVLVPMILLVYATEDLELGAPPFTSWWASYGCQCSSPCPPWPPR